jgi:hypothetical protein
MRHLTQYKGNDNSNGAKNNLGSLPNRRAGNQMISPVPDDDRPRSLDLGGPKHAKDQLGSDDNPGNGRKSVGRARSDDLSSFARSLHEPRKVVKRSSSADLAREPPKKPLPRPQQGILRNSTHHTRSRTMSPASRRGGDDPELGIPVSPSGSKPTQSSSLPVAFHDVADVYYSGDDDSSIEEIAISFDPKPKATPRPSLSRGASLASFNFSSHSLKSTRSQLSIDKDPFEDDPAWKRVLRYLHILPPHKNERPIKRNIRVCTWMVLLFDFIAALVAVTTYNGATTCCGVPVFSMVLKINWDTCFRVVTYLYLIVILAEIIPVVRQGLPFNLLNPTLGFAITIGMFIDDSLAQAVFMWMMEALAIFCEFLVYRMKAVVYEEDTARLLKTDEDLARIKKSQKNILTASRHGGSQSFGLNHSLPFTEQEDDSLSGHSFGENDSNGSFDDMDDEEDPTRKRVGSTDSSSVPSGQDWSSIDRSVSSSGQKSTMTMEAPARIADGRGKSTDELGISAHSMASMASHIPLPWERKQMRLLRARRILRQKQKQEKSELRVHIVGTCINVGLVIISLILIITIASTGGLCFFNGTAKVFDMNQLGRCNQCKGTADVCEVCNSDDNQQCYYPYY